jgi:quinone-modifying oxidoreductase subunit QmoC
MPEAIVIRPDGEFLGRILDSGGEDTKKCFQCATCSVVCELSNGSGPGFPRKEMIWAQWGLKDRLMADPDVWLCHACGDCSDRCPRGARPGDVMAAVRREAILHFAFPGFIARWFGRARYLPLLLALPALLLGLLFARGEQVEAAMGAARTPGPRIIYSFARSVPQPLLIGFFGLFSALALLAVVVGVLRFWRALVLADARNGTQPTRSLPGSILTTLKCVLTHNKFTPCGKQHARYFSHMLVFWGFIAMFVVSLWVMTASINPLLQDFIYPFNFWNPWRLLANLGGLAVLVGCGLMIRERVRDEGKQAGGTYFDWAFLGLLVGVVATGFLSELLHYARLEPHRLGTYYVHLLLVFTLLVYLPYSKFAHMIYRTTAMVYAEYSGRRSPAPASTPGES